MTSPSAPSGAQRVIAARPGRSVVRRAPSAGVGLLTAVALGAGVLFLPVGSPDPADELRNVAAVQPLVQPVQLVVPAPTTTQTTTPTAVPPPARPLRDPFLPLVSDAGVQAPVTVPDTALGAPGDGTSPVGDSAPDFGTSPGDEPPPDFGTPSGDGPAPDIGTPSGDGSSPDFGVPQAPGSRPRIPDTSTGAPSSGGASLVGRRLSLTRVEVAGADFTATLALDGTSTRVKVGAKFGPGAELLLVSVQQGPAPTQWTAVVQRGGGTPFDVVSGAPTRIP